MSEQIEIQKPTYGELEAALVEVKIKHTEEFNARMKAERDLARAQAMLVTERHRIKTLREGLERYKPGPFWDTVTADTDAAADMGKHADWVLRLTASVDDVEGS